MKWSDNQNILFGKYDEHGDRKPAMICSVLAVYNFEPKINKEVDKAMVPARRHSCVGPDFLDPRRGNSDQF